MKEKWLIGISVLVISLLISIVYNISLIHRLNKKEDILKRKLNSLGVCKIEKKEIETEYEMLEKEYAKVLEEAQ